MNTVLKNGRHAYGLPLSFCVMFAAASLAAAGAAFAQSAPPAPLPSSVLCSKCEVSLSATNSSGAVALPSTSPPFNTLTVYNSGTKDAFVNQGGSAVVATTSNVRVPAGAVVTFWVSGTYLAAITGGSDTTTLYVYQSNGPIGLQAVATGIAVVSGTITANQGTAGAGAWPVTLQPTTSGGSSTFSANITTAGTGAGTGGVAVDASPGQLYGYIVTNNNSSVCYIQLFDQTQPLTNLGTTVPKLSIGVPANGGANLTMPNGVPFTVAITAGVTTTRSGSTACATGLDVNLLYK